MSPPVSAAGTPGSSTGHSAVASSTGTHTNTNTSAASSSGAGPSRPERGRTASTSMQRPDSPPYVTANGHQSIEAYQRSFWERQMAKVEEQMLLPGQQGVDGEGNSFDPTALLSSDGDGDDSGARDPAALAAAIPPGISAKDLMELFKPQAGQLPLARIKKVMKASDDDVKMISAEAPILFARACEIFIADLTCRSYMHATAHRRRTVQRSDVVAAVAGSNAFDFLVDIVPRGGGEAGASGSGANAAGGDAAAAARNTAASTSGGPGSHDGDALQQGSLPGHDSFDATTAEDLFEQVEGT